MLTQTGTIDCYWHQPMLNFNPKRVYVYVEGEYGFIPLIIGKALEGKTKPYIEIMSGQQSVDPFNQMPNTINPCWTLTQVTREDVVLSISNWWPLEVDMGKNVDMWSYTYPMLRDIILMLKEHGCQSLTFFTCMNNHEAEQSAELLICDLHNNFIPTQELVLSPPAWIMPFIGHRLGLRCSVIAVTQDEGQFIDTQALTIAKEYFMAMGLPYDNERALKTVKTVKNMENDLNSERWSLHQDEDEEGGWLA